MGSRSLKTSPFERAVIAVLKERLQNADLTIDRLADRRRRPHPARHRTQRGSADAPMVVWGFPMWE